MESLKGWTGFVCVWLVYWMSGACGDVTLGKVMCVCVLCVCVCVVMWVI